MIPAEVPGMERDEEIRLIAYGLWENEGRPEGRALEHWLMAEAMWNERQSPEAQGTPSKPAEQGKKPERRSSARGRAQPNPGAGRVTPKNR